MHPHSLVLGLQAVLELVEILIYLGWIYTHLTVITHTLYSPVHVPVGPLFSLLHSSTVFPRPSLNLHLFSPIGLVVLGSLLTPVVSHARNASRPLEREVIERYRALLFAFNVVTHRNVERTNLHFLTFVKSMTVRVRRACLPTPSKEPR